MSNSINAARERKVLRPHYAPQTIVDHAASTYPWHGLPIASRYDSCRREVRAGRDLFQLGEKGEAIYHLVDGWVALYKLFEDGRRQILQFALPGTILAFVPTRGALINYSAQALTNVVVSTISHNSLDRLTKEHPEAGIQLAGLISRGLSLAYDQLCSVGRRPARERVAHLLLELYVRSRMRWPGCRSEEMHLPLSQELIGDATGLTGIHVNRVLRQLRNEGILEFHYRRLCILNPDKLIDVAGIDPLIVASWIKDDSSSGNVVAASTRNTELKGQSKVGPDANWHATARHTGLRGQILEPFKVKTLALNTSAR